MVTVVGEAAAAATARPGGGEAGARRRGRRGGRRGKWGGRAGPERFQVLVCSRESLSRRDRQLTPSEVDH